MKKFFLGNLIETSSSLKSKILSSIEKKVVTYSPPLPALGMLTLCD